MTDILEKFKRINFKKNKNYILISIGVLGILLISLSQTTTKQSEDQTSIVGQSDEEYCTSLESKVKEIVKGITGDKNAVVAITLETGKEYIYADQNKTDTDQSEDKGENTTLFKESEKTEQEYIIVKNKDGSEDALIITEKKPSIRGVAIVTSGINENLKSEMTASICSVLGISNRKITITARQSWWKA